MTESQIKLKSALTLAFFGDAVYDCLVREYLLERCDAAPGLLHRMAVTVVCAKAQSEALEIISDHLSMSELTITRRGKNASKAAVPRNAAPKDYRAATALEALFGYLSLSDQEERINELFSIISKKQIDTKIDMVKSGAYDDLS